MATRTAENQVAPQKQQTTANEILQLATNCKYFHGKICEESNTLHPLPHTNTNSRRHLASKPCVCVHVCACVVVEGTATALVYGLLMSCSVTITK